MTMRLQIPAYRLLIHYLGPKLNFQSDENYILEEER